MSVANKEALVGIVERITFYNAENGFSVLRVNVKGHKDLVTVIGNTPAVSTGEYIQCTGKWVNNSDHGLQFRAEVLRNLPPNTLEGIEKYLGSGLIKGVGPYLAKQLVKSFGEKVFEVIEQEPEKLLGVEGIGKVRAATISSNWHSQKVVREIMVFLQSHGVSTNMATKIYKSYGDNAIEEVSKNPYNLAKDIRGIGFVSADKIASNLGIGRDSLIRAQAGINYVLLEATNRGHCGLPVNVLLEEAIKLLGIEEVIIKEAIEEEVKLGFLTREHLNNEAAIFLSSYYYYEKKAARLLKVLVKAEMPWDSFDSNKAIEWIEGQSNIKLAGSQKAAIEQVLSNKVLVLTGGPGTGKTTVVSSIVKMLGAKKLRIKLCAPTGRAAKRLSESTGLEATTIHRLLEVDPASGKFKHHEEFRLNCDYLVVDESSMLDVQIFLALLKALPAKSGLLLVGDVDQLPSVGAGQVLKDIIDSEVIATVKLTEVFRQAKDSVIIVNAHLVNKGLLPELYANKDTDFYFIPADAGEDIIKKILFLVKERIPEKFKLNAIRDIQVLCPMQRGSVGVRSLNIELQKTLNPNYINGIERYGQIFAISDKVMQTENNYDKGVYNGDIGYIRKVDRYEQEVVISFDSNEVTYDFNDIDQITLAYATTIHKSQGSEYPAVVMPLTMQSFMMLQRNLVYTGITRGKKLVVIVGEKRALAVAVKQNKGFKRYSKLKDWLLM